MTSSMTPNILAGDAVVTVGPWLRHPVVGEVVVYQVTWGNDELPPISHRIVASRGPGLWTTKGDYNPEEDPWPVPEDRISGVVVLRLPLHYFRDTRIAGVTVGLIAATGVFALFAPRRRNEGDREDIAHGSHQAPA